MQPGSGRLFYVMGASGVGKDTLLDAMRRTGNARVHVACRYTTRGAARPSLLERGLSGPDFKRLAAAGVFWFCWASYDVYYGIRRREEDRLARGWHVLVNGSRAYLERAQACCPDLVPVRITCDDADELRRRLIARGREGRPAIEARIRRGRTLASDLPADTMAIDNSGELATAAMRLRQLLDAY